jgi:predicted RNA-binding Zn-ribbon protein involved in translation (DUF1610 family)
MRTGHNLGASGPRVVGQCQSDIYASDLLPGHTRVDNTATRLGEVALAKYRQHGYQDSDREREPRREEPRKKAPPERKSGPPRWDHALGPKPVNLPGTRAVSRCAQCGTVLQGAASSGEGQCPKCGFELHSCKQCTYFDPGSRFECMQPVKERIAKKDARNECSLYEIRVTREKETSTPATLKPNDARAAFENLFKK